MRKTQCIQVFFIRNTVTIRQMIGQNKVDLNSNSEELVLFISPN